MVGHEKTSGRCWDGFWFNTFIVVYDVLSTIHVVLFMFLFVYFKQQGFALRVSGAFFFCFVRSESEMFGNHCFRL